MIQEGSIFKSPAKLFEIDAQRLHHMDDIFHNAQAMYFYLTHSLRRYLRAMTPDCQIRLSLLKCCFRRFQEAVSSQKAQKIVDFMKVKVFQKLMQYGQRKTRREEKESFNAIKMSTFKSRAILLEWRTVCIVQKSSRILQNARKCEVSKEFLQILRENKESIQYRALQIRTQQLNSHDLYSRKILKKAFQCLNLNVKVEKICHVLRKKFYAEFRKYIILTNKQEKQIITSFRKQHLLKKCFAEWKEVYQLSIAQQFYQRSLTWYYFRQWKISLAYLVSQREIEENNDCIVDIFIERSAKKLLRRAFEGWSTCTVQLQQNRYKNSILNQFAEKKYRHLLLSKYFGKLRLNCINNAVKLKYYCARLKRKGMDGFKLFFRTAVKLEEKVIDFMEHREIKKYFSRIQRFNQEEHLKIERFQLRRFFKVFTGSIIAKYCLDNELADSYYRTSLLFKTLFAFKKEKTFRYQEQYVIGLINIAMPLRRWVKRNRIGNFVKERVWFLKKTIFREWKVMVIRRGSEKKAVSEFQVLISGKKERQNVETKTQQFEFKNIMVTIAKIRSNLDAEKQQVDTSAGRQKRFRTADNASQESIQAQTPSQSVDFQYSLQNT